ncbi:hypothetical protein [Sphingobacterium bambusae]|uniref:Uncharacterized protein n=1 Tax=Sphingobacterium bambusae TaxID=662858 RepID=A0ABW6BCW7_9SPHI|nr:hypothetical protein [Sphingobacterium bambusae]WPL50735.1 hypothetical protein SCB77_09780 [Sphingobacterium bambusae]
MKTALFILAFSLCNGLLYGQTDKLSDRTIRNIQFTKPDTAWKFTPIDTSFYPTNTTKGPFVVEIHPVPIPVASPRMGVQYTTPVKTLSGQGLAPMPGTARLDAYEKAKADSLLANPLYFYNKVIPAK